MSPIDLLTAHGFTSLTLTHPTVPNPKLAAVLILLYHSPNDPNHHLRAKPLSPAAEKTTQTPDLVSTALREANEEVGLPTDTNNIRVLCTLEPVLSLHKIIVTPVVAYLQDPRVLETLRPCEGEVARIFTFPFEAVLDPGVLVEVGEPLVGKGTEDWGYEEDLHHWEDNVVAQLNDTCYRYHRFRSSASPVTGLSADILIKAAQIAYHPRKPTYNPIAPDQITGYDFILLILSHKESDTVPLSGK
ncbi:hypothetical protein AAF712_004993 [Marasmius tenuissimus]|uniref:Spondin domain-containing protein n=1 Tax=Marasmius tenuissimus TaxID=585030 RepID=A0ABR3A2R1_9AGAR